MNISFLLLLGVALVSAHEILGQDKYVRRTIMMKNRGMISPSEVVDYLVYLPHTIDDMDFSRCEASTIQQIMKRLPDAGKEALQKKLTTTAKKQPLRRTVDPICSTIPLPRFATEGRYGVEVDGIWKPSSYSVSHMMSSAQMAFFQDGTANDEQDTLSSEESSSEWRGVAEGDVLEDGFIETRKQRLYEARKRMAHFNGDKSSKLVNNSSDSDEDEAEVLGQFMRRSPPILGEPSEPMWAPPSKPRHLAFLDKKSTIDSSSFLRRRASSSELIESGYRELGNDRFASPTRPQPAQRKAHSRENSNGSGRLSQSLLLKSRKTASILSQKYRGIRNNDNLCYIISVVQALFHIPAVTNAMALIDPSEGKLSNRPAVMALWRLFDNLGKFVDGPADKKQLIEPVKLSKQDINLFSDSHSGQGDASEVFLHLISMASTAIEPLFQSWMQETIMEDRPMGFIFKDKWQSTRFLQYNVLDYDFPSLQHYIDHGVAESVNLILYPESDGRHKEYIERNGLTKEPTLDAVKFSNIIKPGPLLCFHLIRYSTGRNSGQGSPRLSSVQLEYQEEIKILHQTYVLQSVVVHETWPGFGNQGHYYTIARTADEKEPWVELNDSQVTVVSKSHALSKTSSATLLLYALKEDREIALMDSAIGLDLSNMDFIHRDRSDTNMIRHIIQDSTSFSDDFRIEAHQRSLYSRYESKGYSRSTVRQAFAIMKVNPAADMLTLLQTLDSEKTALATEMLTERFPNRALEIEEALQRHKGNYQLALNDLAKASQNQ